MINKIKSYIVGFLLSIVVALPAFADSEFTTGLICEKPSSIAAIVNQIAVEGSEKTSADFVASLDCVIFMPQTFIVDEPPVLITEFVDKSDGQTGYLMESKLTRVTDQQLVTVYFISWDAPGPKKTGFKI